LARFALPAHDVTDAFELDRDTLIGVNDVVEDVGYFAFYSGQVAGEPRGKIAAANGLQGSEQIVLKYAIGGDLNRSGSVLNRWSV